MIAGAYISERSGKETFEGPLTPRSGTRVENGKKLDYRLEF